MTLASSTNDSRSTAGFRSIRGVFRLISGLFLVLAGSMIAACSPARLGADVQSGAAAYAVMDASKAQVPGGDYRISSLDKLDVTVFQEPDLSAKAIEVDSSGNISLPLTGAVKASGKTSSELAREIAARLSQRYLKNPEVAVTVSSSTSQQVTVGGEVTQPGVYDIRGNSTLLQTLALAKGPTQSAARDQVVVFRNVNGQRMGAVFDVAAIGAGRAPDPQILPNDVVVVGFSKARTMWRDILSTVPILNVFRPLAL